MKKEVYWSVKFTDNVNVAQLFVADQVLAFGFPAALCFHIDYGKLKPALCEYVL